MTDPIAAPNAVRASARGRVIDIVAPSGYVEDPMRVSRALAHLRELGHRVENVEATQRRYLRFAGTDAERASDINALADPNRALPDLAIALRGGYGAVRLLHGLDYARLGERLRAHPVPMIGHSDFTALQMALYAKAGLITFGGPMLGTDFGAQTPNAFTMRNFWGILQQPSYTVSGSESGQPDADVSGTLWGGNLAMLSSLMGTPYMPAVDGGILFVEDVGEQPFRVERMLYQLHLSGVLQRQRALLLGHFTQQRTTAYDNGFDMPAVVRQMREVIGIPVITGLPFGHVEEMLTLPVGANASLKAGRHDARGAFSLTVSDYPCLS